MRDAWTGPFRVADFSSSENVHTGTRTIEEEIERWDGEAAAAWLDGIRRIDPSCPVAAAWRADRAGSGCPILLWAGTLDPALVPDELWWRAWILATAASLVDGGASNVGILAAMARRRGFAAPQLQEALGTVRAYMACGDEWIDAFSDGLSLVRKLAHEPFRLLRAGDYAQLLGHLALPPREDAEVYASRIADPRYRAAWERSWEAARAGTREARLALDPVFYPDFLDPFVDPLADPILGPVSHEGAAEAMRMPSARWVAHALRRLAGALRDPESHRARLVDEALLAPATTTSQVTRDLRNSLSSVLKLGTVAEADPADILSLAGERAGIAMALVLRPDVASDVRGPLVRCWLAHEAPFEGRAEARIWMKRRAAGRDGIIAPFPINADDLPRLAAGLTHADAEMREFAFAVLGRAVPVGTVPGGALAPALPSAPAADVPAARSRPAGPTT